MKVRFGRFGFHFTCLVIFILLCSGVPVHAQTEEWISQDIGAVNPAGTSSYHEASGLFTVAGSGADIWGSADAFHFVHRPLAGNGTFIARVASVQNTHAWARAGLMLRESTAANARNAALFVTAGNGVVFQRRLATGGGTTITSTGNLIAPVWLKMELKGDAVYAWYSSNGTSWTLLGTETFAIPGVLRAGLAVGSHKTGSLCTATFDGVALTESSPRTLPAPWVEADVGNPAKPGQGYFENGVFSIHGGGADIWYAADQFRYAFQPLAGDGAVTARLAAQQNTDGWARAGVMLRESLDAGAKNVTLALTPGYGLSFQSRGVTNGNTGNTVPFAAATAPRWLRLERLGSLVRAFQSVDGGQWSLFGEITQPMNQQIYAGLAVGSHSASALSRALFDSVEVSPQPLYPLPMPWQHFDIGAVGLAGAAEYEAGEFTLWGAGADIWGSADAFHFAAQPATGNGVLIARLTAQQATAGWARAGLMIRGSLSADAAEASLFVTPGHGILFQQRSAAGAGTTSQSSPARPFPVWLKLEHYFPYVAGYVSSDGLTWDYAGHALMNLPSATWMGLVAHSHSTNSLSAVSFDNVSISTNAGMNGLTGSYYAGSNFNHLSFSRVDPAIDFDWGTGSPSAALPNTGFSIRWEGRVQPRYSETYTFRTTADDGVRLWVNGQLIINDWTVHEAQERSGTITLEADHFYDLKLEYFQSNAQPPYSSVRLEWSSPHQPREIIPPQRLKPAEENPDTDGNRLFDAWGRQHFGRIGVDPNDDPDNDSLTNLEEFLARSDPHVFAPGEFNKVPVRVGIRDGGYEPDDTWWVLVNGARLVRNWRGVEDSEGIPKFYYATAWLDWGSTVNFTIQGIEWNSGQGREYAITFDNVGLGFPSAIPWTELPGNSVLQQKIGSSVDEATLHWTFKIDALDEDDDGLTFSSELNRNTDPRNPDSDNDLLRDGWEVACGFNPKNPNDGPLDPDLDGLTNVEEQLHGTDPWKIDSDFDSIPDKWEVQHGLNPLDYRDGRADPDEDGLANDLEYRADTDPHRTDTDHDAIPDDWEVAHALQPKQAADAAADPDSDGLSNLLEYQFDTNPGLSDSDADGIPDRWEIMHGSDPRDAADAFTASLFRNGLTNLAQSRDPGADSDGDGLSDAAEILWKTYASTADTDRDGLPDGYEVANGLDPKNQGDATGDSDADGLTNLTEYKEDLLPYHYDSDGDGLGDGWEKALGLNPATFTAGLVAWWRFDDGSAAYDYRGYYDGILHKSADIGWDNLHQGTLSLREDDAYVIIPDGPGLILNGDFTLCFWIKPAATQAAEISEVLSKGSEWSVTLQDDLILAMTLSTTGGGAIRTWQSPEPLIADEWNHVAFTFRAATGAAAIHLDGQLRASATLPVASLQTTDWPLIIGSPR